MDLSYSFQSGVTARNNSMCSTHLIRVRYNRYSLLGTIQCAPHAWFFFCSCQSALTPRNNSRCSACLVFLVSIRAKMHRTRFNSNIGIFIMSTKAKAMKVLEGSAKEILDGCKVKESMWYFASSFEEGIANCVKRFSDTSKAASGQLIHCRPLRFKELHGEKSLEVLASLKAHICTREPHCNFKTFVSGAF